MATIRNSFKSQDNPRAAPIDLVGPAPFDALRPLARLLAQQAARYSCCPLAACS